MKKDNEEETNKEEKEKTKHEDLNQDKVLIEGEVEDIFHNIDKKSTNQTAELIGNFYKKLLEYGLSEEQAFIMTDKFFFGVEIQMGGMGDLPFFL